MFISAHFVLENTWKCLKSNLVSLASFGIARHRTSMSEMSTLHISEYGLHRPSAARMNKRASRTR